MKAEKKALVLAGGGSRGAYQIGVWQALRELGYDFSIITGASVGALNGAMIAQGDFDKAKWLWEHITLEQVLDIKLPEGFEKLGEREQAQVFLREAIRGGGAGYEALKSLLTECLDEQAVRDSQMKLGIVTVKIPGYTPCTLFQRDIPEGKMIDYLLASAACFPAMKSYSIDGESYIDGGYYDNLPIELAQKQGATEILAVDVDSIGLRRRYDKKKSKVHVLHPKEDLGFFMKFEPMQAKSNIQFGYFDTLKYFGKLDGIRYTFQKGELTKSHLQLRPKAAALSKKLGVYLGGKPRSPLESLARFSAAKAIRKHQRRETTHRSIFSCALEFCAQVYGLRADKLYTASEMHGQIKAFFTESYQNFDRKMETVFSALKGERQAVGEARELLKNLDQKTLVCFSYSLLEESMKDHSKLSLFWMAFCCIPTECLCALYLSLLFR